ncbi:MAG TPA: hypothetical protein VMU37_02270 [Caulobacteraceae bacterium]|nr:hypothetical protein [Caulobacteraceae bacterium]
MNDRNTRSLRHLDDTASTARVLNLLRIHRRRHGVDPDHAAKPFFKSSALNRAIILKHRLRRHEKDLFFDGRTTATKLILPIDGEDLRVGGQSLFVGQKTFDKIMGAAFGETWLTDGVDRELLEVLDALPSLDPFLLREALKRHGREPARCYFDISDADLARMYAFVEREIQKLIDLCFGPDGDDGHQASRLVRKILSDTVDAETEPLRLTLQLGKREYREGVFSWKGFLYYKWVMAEMLPAVAGVSKAIAGLKPRGPADSETRGYVERARTSLVGAIGRAIEAAETSLAAYDNAFDGLVGGNPQDFRDFLLRAPTMFCDLGERLGAVSHIVSFWTFRFPASESPVVTWPELLDIFSDFEASLAFNAPQTRPQPTPVIIDGFR